MDITSIITDLKNTFKDIKPGESKSFSFNINNTVMEAKISPIKKVGPRIIGELAEGKALIGMSKLLKSKNINVDINEKEIYSQFKKRKDKLLQNIKNLSNDEVKIIKNEALRELTAGKNLANAFINQLETEVKDAQFCTVKLEWLGGEGEKTDVRITVTKPETNKMVATFLNSIKTGNSSFRINGTDASDIGVYLYNWFVPEKLSSEFASKGGRFKWKQFYGNEINKYKKIKSDIPEFTEYCDLKIKELEQFNNIKGKSDFNDEYLVLNKQIIKALANNLQKAFNKYGKDAKLNFLSQQGIDGKYNIFMALKDKNNKVISKYTSPQFKNVIDKFINNVDLKVVYDGTSQIKVKLGDITFFTIDIKKEYQQGAAQIGFKDFK